MKKARREAEAPLMLARFLSRLGRLDEAGPESAAARLASGDAFLAQALSQAAEAVYEKVLTLDPGNGDAVLGIARSYRAGRQWSRAIGAYERLPEVDPRREAESHLGVAWSYCLSRDLYKARFDAGLAAQAGAPMRKLRAALSDECKTARDD